MADSNPKCNISTCMNMAGVDALSKRVPQDMEVGQSDLGAQSGR